MIFIRGAITVKENTKEEILNQTEKLLCEVIKKNGLKISDILSILFTATKDLDMAYPAVAARKIGVTEAALMCFQEMYVVGSLEKCIRCTVICENEKVQTQAQHVYLEKAEILRPDLKE